MAFMPTKGDGALASLDWSDEERARLAKRSISWKCDKCGVHNITALPPEDKEEQINTAEIAELAASLRLKNKEEQLKDEKEKEGKERLTNETSTKTAPENAQSNPTPNSLSFETNSSLITQPEGETALINQDVPQIERTREHHTNNTLSTVSPKKNNSSTRTLDVLAVGLLFLILALVLHKMGFTLS
eukprot:TRINITY_DN5361_c0_g1_i1.p1 TRINITY_DN5361_c0_g1~~TRINITY_DN5361_c0_g1_i1.p1  ORF type:complete len:187 (+),score=44.79 TRINITY_DN5361_c0_g1_i1:386-946(+)